jgi:protein-tyrosine phosphatase
MAFVASVGFIVLAAAAACAAVVPICPVGGERVSLLPDGQLDVIAQQAYSNRIERLREKWIGKKDAEGQWGMSRPLVLRWRVTDGEQGPWKIEIGKKEDLSDARVWLVAAQKPRLRGEKDTQVFGLKLADANLEVGQTYHWRVWSNVKCTRAVSCGSTLSSPCTCGHGKVACASSVATFTTDGQPPRWIALEGRVKNVRDIGGWRTHDGRRVKQGMAFRGQALNDDSVDGETAGRNRLTVEDVRYLRDTLKIRTDLDLRTPSEVAGMTKSPIGDGIRFIRHPSPAYAGLFSKDGKGSGLADEGKKTMAANFRIFCDKKNYPIFFHCIGGTDRTGSLAYVLNAVLGVDRHDLEVDWESTLYPDRIPELRSDYSGKRGWRSKEYFDDGFAKYGDANTSWNDRVVLYLLDCGITKEEIERFRSIMLEPQPR